MDDIVDPLFTDSDFYLIDNHSYQKSLQDDYKTLSSYDFINSLLEAKLINREQYNVFISRLDNVYEKISD